MFRLEVSLSNDGDIYVIAGEVSSQLVDGVRLGQCRRVQYVQRRREFINAVQQFFASTERYRAQCRETRCRLAELFMAPRFSTAIG